MKRLLTLLLTMLLAFNLIAGCASEETSTTTSAVEKTILEDPIETEYGLVSGSVIGEDGEDVHIYKGIPYAAPPVGDLRWKPPQPPTAWTGVLEATEYSFAAPQRDPDKDPDFKQSEDCLYLNVLTPAEKTTDNLPVMVWLHGGGLYLMSGNEPVFNLPELPSHGIVLVTVNTRLGILGLLSHPLLSAESPDAVSGNYMFLDMIAALEWVQDNIVAFGGDPNNVTIFGESGGGIKVGDLLASPMAEGLFHRAILQSGVSVEGVLKSHPMPLSDTEKIGEDIFSKLGLDKLEDPLAAARALPWEDIIAEGAGLLDAVIDGHFLTDTPSNIFADGRQNPVPFITVANKGEITGPGLLLYPVLIPAYTEMLSNAGKAGVKGYAAIFERVPDNWESDGAVPCHYMEIPYVFGDMTGDSECWLTVKLFAAGTGAVKQDPGLTGEDRQLSENIMTIWTQFAKTGDPSVPGLVEWPVYDPANDEYLCLDLPLEIKSGFSSIAPEPAPELIPKPSEQSNEIVTQDVPTTKGVYTWQEAADHIGEDATVVGPIVESYDWKAAGMGTNLALGMGMGIFEEGVFIVAITGTVDRSELPDDLWMNKEIMVTGKIKQRPPPFVGAMIDVTDLSQIETK